MAGSVASGGNRVSGPDLTPTDGLPEAPEGRTDAFYAHWSSLLAKLHSGILRRVDVFQLSILVEHLCEIDQLNEIISKNPSDLKARSLRLRVGQQVARLSAQFGMSPIDRQRMKIEPEKEPDAFDQWMASHLGRKPDQRN